MKKGLEEGGRESREVGVAKANSFCDDIFLNHFTDKGFKKCTNRIKLLFVKINPKIQRYYAKFCEVWMASPQDFLPRCYSRHQGFFLFFFFRLQGEILRTCLHARAENERRPPCPLALCPSMPSVPYKKTTYWFRS